MNYNNSHFKANNQLWVEKYRPKNLDEYIGDKELKEKINKIFSSQEVPNIIFHSSSGTGKTSLSNLIIQYVNCDYIYINASNENGIDTVRETIDEFCTTSSFKPVKIVWCEEFSEFTTAGQNALRAVIEKHSRKVRFIFTCNSVEKIIDPIKSRCQEFEIIPPNQKQVVEKCVDILNKEKIDFELDEVENTVKFTYPDVRRAINSLQINTIDKVLKLDKEFFKLLSYQNQIIEILKNVKERNALEKVNEIRQLLADTRVKNFATLYRYLYDHVDVFCKDQIISAILTISEGQLNDVHAVDKEINMIATILKLIELKTEKNK